MIVRCVVADSTFTAGYFTTLRLDLLRCLIVVDLLRLFAFVGCLPHVYVYVTLHFTLFTFVGWLLLDLFCRVVAVTFVRCRLRWVTVVHFGYYAFYVTFTVVHTLHLFGYLYVGHLRSHAFTRSRSAVTDFAFTLPFTVGSVTFLTTVRYTLLPRCHGYLHVYALLVTVVHRWFTVTVAATLPRVACLVVPVWLLRLRSVVCYVTLIYIYDFVWLVVALDCRFWLRLRLVAARLLRTLCPVPRVWLRCYTLLPLFYVCVRGCYRCCCLVLRYLYGWFVPRSGYVGCLRIRLHRVYYRVIPVVAAVG